MIGQILSHYRILGQIGAGGMGEVYRAHDVRLERDVALKVLPSGTLADEAARKRFRKEALALSKLNHPNIATVHDFDRQEGMDFLVMEYVAGKTLGEMLHTGPLAEKEIARLGIELAEGLAAAHGQGVIHRDLKPGNVRLTPDGRLKILDFGLAKLVQRPGASPEAVTTQTVSVTEARAPVGTLPYMAPEQLRGERVDARSDLWAAGLVLYELATGRRAFSDADPARLIASILQEAPPSPSGANRRVSPGLDSIIAKCLEKDPESRYQSAKELAVDLRRLGAPSSGPGISQARRARRRRWIVAAGVALPAIAAGLLAWSEGWLPGHHPQAPALGKKDWILVAAFDGPADDSSLAGATRDLVSAALDQSQIVATVPDEQIKVALERAGKPVNTRVDAGLAHELAYRRAIRAVVEGRISRLGRGYAIVVRVVDADSTRAVLTVSDAAASQDHLIPVVGRVARRLREGLGERRSAVRASRELVDMATPSFEAYRKSLRARQLLLNFDLRACITVAREALALDPDFALPWATMGSAFFNLGERDSALAAYSEALRRSGRVTELWQFMWRAPVARLEGDLQGALAFLDRATEVDPNFYGAYNHRGWILRDLGRHEEALASWRRGVELSPFGTNQIVLGSMVYVLVGLGRLNEARQVARDLKGGNELWAAIILAIAEPNWVRAESLGIAVETDLSATAERRADGAWSLAIAQAASGRVKAAAGALRRGQAFPASRVWAEDWKRARLLLAQVNGDLARVPEGVRSRDSSTVVLTTQALWEAAAGDTARARRLLAAIRRRSAIELARQGSAPTLVEAWIAARAGRWLESAQTLAPAARQGDDVGDLDVNTGRVLKRWLVAEAYERIGRPDSAAAYFELAISPIGSASALYESRIAYSFGHRRCVLLYARMGRIEEARRHWRIFAATFTRPDPEMVPLVEEARAALVSAEAMAKSARR